jgi:hypothetical protein
MGWGPEPALPLRGTIDWSTEPCARCQHTYYRHTFKLAGVCQQPGCTCPRYTHAKLLCGQCPHSYGVHGSNGNCGQCACFNPRTVYACAEPDGNAVADRYAAKPAAAGAAPPPGNVATTNAVVDEEFRFFKGAATAVHGGPWTCTWPGCGEQLRADEVSCWKCAARGVPR